jgi:nitrogen fixation/metabolism regulation signal transduction histidine kinase
VKLQRPSAARPRGVLTIGLVVLALVVAALLAADVATPLTPVTGVAERVAPANLALSLPFQSPAEAAVDRVRQLTGRSESLAVRKLVLIHADDESVDLRAKVEGVSFCRWIGVGGVVEDGKLAWSSAGAGEGTAC